MVDVARGQLFELRGGVVVSYRLVLQATVVGHWPEVLGCFAEGLVLDGLVECCAWQEEVHDVAVEGVRSAAQCLQFDGVVQFTTFEIGYRLLGHAHTGC